jgi:SAM-dependent methyltransferase
MSDEEKTLDSEDVRSQVRQHYGRIATEFDVEEVASCCGPADSSSCGCGPAEEINIDLVSKLYEASDLSDLPEDVTGISLGCGDPVTLASLEPGQTVLDLGSGGGIDVFLAAKQVGETGHVIGVDMTAAMIEKARANQEKIGAGNVEFRLGEIEHLPTADETVDVVISNCVINLSPDKPQVFRETFRVLRPGGRLAVSDIVTNGPLPETIKQSMAAWAGCVAGALDVDDYVAAIEEAGFVDVKVEPVYMDKTLIDDAIDQLDLREAVEAGEASGRKAYMVVDGNKAVPIDLGDNGAETGSSVYEAIFSAKVTAIKPEK